jgi:hypothetical protein
VLDRYSVYLLYWYESTRTDQEPTCCIVAVACTVGERLMTGLIVCSLFKNFCNSGSRTFKKQKFEAGPGTVWSCETSEGTLAGAAFTTSEGRCR